MILELILAVILQWNLQNKNLEERVGNGKLQFSVYILRSDVGASRRNFTLGDSRFQTEEKEIQSQQKLAANASQHGSSYSGTGTQVEIVAKDTQYFNCVSFAKAKSGITKSIGAGGRSGVNSQTPQVGAIGVEAGKIPHAAYIEKVEGEKIVVLESNYLKGWITRRILTRSDFLGFII